MHLTNLPVHPRTGLTAVGIVNGRPVWPILGGSEPPADPPAPPADPPAPKPAPPTPPASPPADPPEETDWKAKAREWEKRAKENKTAADELAKVKAAAMTDQEKAVEAAKAEGRTAAATEYGRKLARAEFRAAVAAAGIDLGEASDLIDTAQFVDDKGEVDEAAIKTAVGKLAKVAAKKGAPRSGGDGPPGGGGGDGTKRPGLAAAIANAYKT